jgi:hypothetical protein
MSLTYSNPETYSNPFTYDGLGLGTSYIFTTPTVGDEPPYLPDSTPIQIGLWRHYAPGIRGVNVFLLSNDTFVQDTATAENQNTNIPYPIDFNNPSSPYVYITNFDGTVEEFYQDPYVVQQFFGGTQNIVSGEIADLLAAQGYADCLTPIA